jgi:hypothetical protein
MPGGTQLRWESRNSLLLLRAGDRHAPAPRLITALLLGDAGHGLSDDPAVDLLRLELDLRRYARFLDDKVSAAAEQVAYGCRVVLLSHAEPGRVGRRYRWLACQYLVTAAALHRAQVAEYRRVRSWISQVRQFVIDAGVRDGLLAEAATGWRRRPDKPAFVTVFTTITQFVEASPDRADPEWWAYRNDMPGSLYGEFWRRDGDDDDAQAAPLPRSGPWRLAYLPQTGEVYACRRAGRRPEEVWLLSTGWHDEIAITKLLTELRAHMREPNSLILVAHALHDAEQSRSSVRVGPTTAHRVRRHADAATDTQVVDDCPQRAPDVAQHRTGV